VRVEMARRRSTLREGAAGPEIVIPAKKNWFVLVFLPVWLTGWAFGLAGASHELVSGRMRDEAGPFLVVWLVGWSLGGAFALYTWLWNAVGREIVGIGPGILAIRREVAGLGRTREYDLVEVKNLRVSPAPPDPFGWGGSARLGGSGTGTMAFDYGAKTVRFGGGIDEAEAATVIDELGGRRAPPAFPCRASTP
jgi:hypothetical protein